MFIASAIASVLLGSAMIYLDSPHRSEWTLKGWFYALVPPAWSVGMVIREAWGYYQPKKARIKDEF